jgi:hypothetical protein
MSFKTCLFVSALLLPACIDPAVQGSTATTTGSTGSTGTTTGTSDVTSDPTTGSVITTDVTTGTATTSPASCDDSELNQDESDVDCGGGCPPCDADAMCDGDIDCKSGSCEAGKCFPLVRSCRELNMLLPDLPSGAYPLDPDGDSANPLEFFCDMEPPNPGWTQVFIDELEPTPAMGVWAPVVTGECGDSGVILGPYGMGDALALTITAQQVPHTELRLTAEIMFMDSWALSNPDLIQINLDGVEIFNMNCDESKADACGYTVSMCGDPLFKDVELPIPVDPVAHDVDSIPLVFTSTLDEPIANESWGLDKVVVFVK